MCSNNKLYFKQMEAREYLYYQGFFFVAIFFFFFGKKISCVMKWIKNISIFK